jgi:hypothetical protein
MKSFIQKFIQTIYVINSNIFLGALVSPTYREEDSVVEHPNFRLSIPE